MTDWPHSPIHRLDEAGTFMVTAGTYEKAHLLRQPERLRLFQDKLFVLAIEFGWMLQAWSIFSNHYHIVGMSSNPSSLPTLIRRLHGATSHEINRLDGVHGRKVWFQYWDTKLTYESSYLARLRYVHQNPVRHGLVNVACQYPWCSAAWFESKADLPFIKSVNSFSIDRLSIRDDFDVQLGDESPW